MSSIRVTLYGKCLRNWEMVTRLCIRICFVDFGAKHKILNIEFVRLGLGGIQS